MRKGICKNIGICNNANSHKIIIITDDDAPFECPECGSELEPYKEEEISEGGGNKNKKIAIICGIIAIVVLFVFLGIWVNKGSEEPNGAIVPVDTIETQDTQKISTPDTVIIERVDTVRDTVKQETKVIKEKTTTITNEESKPVVKNGTIKLSYGTYNGDTKKGYPEGMGRLTYSTSRVINKYDDKKRTANAGDYVIGEFVNGFFVQGKHYNSNGDLLETIMVGVPVTNEYESK